MTPQIFINLPVKDLAKSVQFFKALGYSFNPRFTDATAACMVISDDIYAMLLTHAKFEQVTSRNICDTTKSNEVVICLSCESRRHVDDLVRRAVAAGGAACGDPDDYGFMYSHGFQDPDGHLWNLMHMDKTATPEHHS